MKEWYCAFDGISPEGPFSTDELKKMIEDGRLTLDTMLWNGTPGKAEKGWLKASATELAPFFPLPLSPPVGDPVKKPVWQHAEPSLQSSQAASPMKQRFVRLTPGLRKLIKAVVWVVILFIILKIVKYTFLWQSIGPILDKAMDFINSYLIRWLGIAL
ncbi:MAG: DUF4339 domain-containing protein [Synergistaceae bacterium]|jgi:hypothetical protein|nr:DUF4339 domain-containing protein [Synergistaceae bacterium]